MTGDRATPGGGDAAGDGLPLYLQVASTLRTAILRGIYPAGSRMPTEEDLCLRFKVSRHTIREALRRLRTDGFITSRPGSRPIVAPPARPRPERVSDEIGDDFFDYTIGTRLEIESMKMIELTPELADGGWMLPGEQWLSVTGYRVSADAGDITCWNDYLVHAKFAKVGRLLARHVGPMLPLLEDMFSERITAISRSMSAVPMPAAQATRFGLEPGCPALHILTRCETAGGITAMINRSIHPSGTVSYSIRR